MSTFGILLAAVLHAPEWITAGMWTTPGALSLDGLSSERDLRPNAGDRYTYTNFDTVYATNWTTCARQDQRGYVVMPKCNGFSWTEGSAYGFVWVISPDDRVVTLRCSASGGAQTLWVNGAKRPSLKTRFDPVQRVKTTAHTDQGNEIEVEVTTGGMEATYSLPLVKGANRLLLKLYTKQPKGTDVFFDAEFEDAEGCEFKTSAPEIDGARHAAIMNLDSTVYVEAPGNLLHPGEEIVLKTIVVPPPPPCAKKGQKVVAPPAPEPFTVKCVQTISDFDGLEFAQRSFTMTFPGTNVTKFGSVPANGLGYYQIRTDVLDENGRALASLRPDGFSVIAGTKARRERHEKGLNKVTTCFYWMNTIPDNIHNCENFLPWMSQMGILHNIGGACKNGELMAKAKEYGITFTADFLDPWCAEKPEAKIESAKTAAPYTKYYKAWNEIDISPFRLKTSTTNWTNRVRTEWEAVHAARPDAIYTGPTFSHVGNSKWFADCLKQGWADYVDVWDVHAYPKNAPNLEDKHVTNSSNESGSGVEVALKKTLGKKNDKKFIMGEWGPRSSHGREGRIWQIGMTTKMVAWLGSNPNYLMGGFLVPWENRELACGHQPCEAALYTASALIDGFPYSRYEVGFERERFEAGLFGKTLIIWTKNGITDERSFRPPFEGDLVLVDAIGRVKPLPRDAQGLVKVAFSESPVYILEASEYTRLTE